VRREIVHTCYLSGSFCSKPRDCTGYVSLDIRGTSKRRVRTKGLCISSHPLEPSSGATYRVGISLSQADATGVLEWAHAYQKRAQEHKNGLHYPGTTTNRGYKSTLSRVIWHERGSRNNHANRRSGWFREVADTGTTTHPINQPLCGDVHPDWSEAIEPTPPGEVTRCGSFLKGSDPL